MLYVSASSAEFVFEVRESFMPSRIEDYALIGDCHTAALVGRDGSIDWLCLPRFDSGACFAALLGTSDHGRWLLAPAVPIKAVRRQYREGTLVLETEFETDSGCARVVDCMPPRDETIDLLRIVEGVRGQVPMRLELVIRFDYGSIVPWVRRHPRGITAIAGPDMILFRSDVELRGEDFRTLSEFTVSERQRVKFGLNWYPSNEDAPQELDIEEGVVDAERQWREWSEGCKYKGPWREAVLRSLITIKAMTYAPTGGIVAAPTTSLPEKFGGVRNWDYRLCWLRDATFALYALMNAGYLDEARAWREWLLRAVAGRPDQTQIMYGLAGERRLTEVELPWLPGYEGSRPVRIGNAATTQFQLDVYGEIMDVLHQARRSGLDRSEESLRVQTALLEFLESHWDEPDEGIWEVRGGRRHFTHSKVMAWVAFDRAVQRVEEFGLTGPVDRWRAIRDAIHREVCEKGFHPEVGAFTQDYGSKHLDASLLMLPMVGFLPTTDPRVRGTIEAIERDLNRDGFILRYPPESAVDGLPPGEGVFLLCTFWLADCYALLGRHEDACRLYERLLDLRNDVGLLSEEYDPGHQRMLGNFPQAFSHVGLINTAFNLARDGRGPAEQRGRQA
jgi:GH15 family glucan-1,4-alpha-glucosidase